MAPAYASSLLDALPEPVLTIDRDSTIIGANRAALDLFGFERDDFVGRLLAETIIPAELRAQHLRGMERYAATGHGPVIGRRIEIVAVDRSGRQFPIELTVFIDDDAQGRRFHATIRDISDRAAASAQATAAQTRLREFLDATSDAWWDTSLGGATQYSDGVTALLRLGEGAPIEHDPGHLPVIHEDDRVRVLEAWNAHLSGESGRYECTHRIVAPGGEIRWIRAQGRSVDFVDGRPSRVVGTLTDVTDMQAAEEALRNAQRLEMLGLLAGGFAHDLNNLLAVIRGQVALIASEQGVTVSTLESVESIQLATTKAKMLTSNMLSLGKPGSGAARRFGVAAAIEETLQLIAPGLPKSISVSLDLRAASAVEVEMNETAFQQAILNLVVNARDAMPGGGVLRVTAIPRDGERDGREVAIIVEDTGQGIESERLSRIFEPFFSTKPRGVGTGLGLAVVAQAVRGGGGSISVESELGRGTRFTIRLPVAAEPAGRTEAGAGEATGTTGTSGTSDISAMRVLLAEDHPLLRPMLTDSLRAAGLDVVVFEDGGAACSWVESEGRSVGFDACISDVSMPSLDGLRMHARLESMLGRLVPVVFITGEPETTLPPDAPAHMRLLYKPFEPAALLRALQEVVRGASASGR